MTARALLAAGLIWALTAPMAGQMAGQTGAPQAALAAAIDQLGAFDFPVRMNASRTVRRAPAAEAVPALTAAARTHKDSYVQFRALVLLTGFEDPAKSSLAPLMAEMMADRNDRVRAVAYAWYEHHPAEAPVPALLDALERETSEFVRPALTRALAAQAGPATPSGDPAVRAKLGRLVMSGEDFFRGEVIQALGDYRARWAAADILEIAKLDGPLQDDAVLAVGKMDPGGVALRTLADLQKSVPRDRQPAIAAAVCLMGTNCEGQRKFLADSLKYAASTSAAQPLLRSTSQALAALAGRGDRAAFEILFQNAVGASDTAEAPIALAIGLGAIRQPVLVLELLAAPEGRDARITVLRDAFDMLEEDYEEERFYVTVRRAFWAAPDGSAARAVAQAVLEKLEF